MIETKVIGDYRSMLFPYADATEICGLSTEGIYLIGDKKSIDWVKNHAHRSQQLEQYKRLYDESIERCRKQMEDLNTRLRVMEAESERYLDARL